MRSPAPLARAVKEAASSVLQAPLSGQSHGAEPERVETRSLLRQISRHPMSSQAVALGPADHAGRAERASNILEFGVPEAAATEGDSTTVEMREIR